MQKCFKCGQPVIFDEGHYNAIDEEKIMCIECYDKIFKSFIQPKEE